MIEKQKIPEKFGKIMGVNSLSISTNKNVLNDAQQWEPHIQSVLGRILQPDNVFLDIGAHVGTHTVFASKFVKEVIAIEPNKETFKHLLKTVELNKCDNVTCHNIGLWDQDETRLFCHTPQSAGDSHFTTVDYYESDAIKYIVEVKKLDNLKLPHVDVVKIDVEGVEKFVLRGGARLFEKCPILFIELNAEACYTNTGENLLNTIHQIMSFGYETIYYAHPVINNNPITIPLRGYRPIRWSKINFNKLMRWMDQVFINLKQGIKGYIYTDMIFMPPGKMITGL